MAIQNGNRVGSYDYELLKLPTVTPKKQIPCPVRDEYLERLWNIALDDIEKSHNTVTPFGTVFSAGAYGKEFHQLVFCRDNAYSGLLSLNELYPEEMLEAYHAIRKVRDRLGWTCFTECGCHLEGIDGVTDDDLPRLDFFKKYQKASAINKTDDVVWLWAFDDLLQKNPRFEEAERNWLYKAGKTAFDRYYTPFYDTEDGLYFGQPTFIDVGGSGYPDGFNKAEQTERNRCVWVKASSTNALYYKGLCVMAESAEKLGLVGEAVDWKRRADCLKAAMKKYLRFENGAFAYFRHRDGHLEDRRETLGSALPVLCGVVEGEEARRTLAGYPVTSYGTPLLFPFYKRDDRYHNNSMWPFADTFFLMAYEKAFAISTVEVNLQIMRNAFQKEHFYELRDTATNTAAGSYAQLWSTAAFLNVILRKGK